MYFIAQYNVFVSSAEAFLSEKAAYTVKYTIYSLELFETVLRNLGCKKELHALGSKFSSHFGILILCF